ncbi:unnamed protein product [Amoebophrya sp. A120]|nr:unnamed protein product [Amoebophrya sp. A120]|eukprot:GSA120T00015535001.1
MVLSTTTTPRGAAGPLGAAAAASPSSPSTSRAISAKAKVEQQEYETEAQIREKKRLGLLAELQLLGQQNEELADKIESARFADTDVFHAQKLQLQSKVLHEIADIQTLSQDVSRQLKTAAPLDDAEQDYRVARRNLGDDPILLKKALEATEKKFEKQEKQIKRLVLAEHDAEKARDVLQKDMKDKISVFSHVRRKYVVQNDKLKSEHAAMSEECQQLRRSSYLQEKRILELEDQIENFGVDQLERTISKRMEHATEQEKKLKDALKSCKEELVQARRENENLWHKLKVQTTAFEDLRKTSETQLYAVKQKLAKVAQQKNTDVERLDTKDERIKFLEKEVKYYKSELLKRKVAIQQRSASGGGTGTAAAGGANGPLPPTSGGAPLSPRAAAGAGVGKVQTKKEKSQSPRRPGGGGGDVSGGGKRTAVDAGPVLNPWP